VSLLKPYRALSRDGGISLQAPSGNYFSSCHSKEPQMRRIRLVGKYETVPTNGERTVLLGNLRPDIFAGSSMVLSVRVNVRRTGPRR